MSTMELDRVYTLGMNIHIFVQTKLNAKRKKRRGKAIKLLDKPKLPRVVHILRTGKLKERTHYREVDPYWGVMWRQYEYLRYLDFYLKIIISKKIDDGIIDPNGDEKQKQLYEDYMNLVKELDKWRKKLAHWLFNAFHIQIGGVLSARFYGWKDEFGHMFVGKFYEIASDLLYKLRFDIEKTRCSVYFYQAFWLGGLSVIQDIRKKLFKEKKVTPNFNRGSKVFSLEEYEDFDNIDFVSQYVENCDYDNDFIASLSTSDDELIATEDTNTKQKCEMDTDGVDENEVTVSVEELDQLEDESSDLESLIEGMSEQEIKLKAVEIIRRLMLELNISPDILYASSSDSKQNKIINYLKSKIKKALKQGRIKLTDEDKAILSAYLGKLVM